MAFEGLKIEEITEAHINALIGVSEGRDLDFKQATYGNADGDKREFLADISAFANTVGGHIVVGVAENDGIATGIVPFTANADTEIQRLESITLTGVQPRIIGVRIRAVPLAAGGTVLILHVPRSWNGPHRVIAQSSNRFYMRAGTRKYEPDVEELRQLFTSGPTFTQRLRDFQYDRIAKISGGATPVPILGDGILALHIIPYSAFLTANQLDMAKLTDTKNDFRPIRYNAASWRINLEGIVWYALERESTVSPGYTQVWRNGCVEVVQCRIAWTPSGDKSAGLPALVRDLISGCTDYLRGLNGLGINPPICILITMMGVDDVNLLIGQQIIYGEAGKFDRDMLFFSEIIIDSYPQAADMPLILKPIFDQIAQAAGYECAPDFDVKGNIRRS